MDLRCVASQTRVRNLTSCTKFKKWKNTMDVGQSRQQPCVHCLVLLWSPLPESPLFLHRCTSEDLLWPLTMCDQVMKCSWMLGQTHWNCRVKWWILIIKCKFRDQLIKAILRRKMLEVDNSILNYLSILVYELWIVNITVFMIATNLQIPRK